MTTIGYARVSTQDQDLSGQLAALKGAGASTVFKEKVSGVKADRPQLAKLMKTLQPGDVVIVAKLDRLGRSTRELLNLLHQIDEAGAAFTAVRHDHFARPPALHDACRLCLFRARSDP
jgi:DNA invertase Pin-like site-specific DNA recombinase